MRNLNINSMGIHYSNGSGEVLTFHWNTFLLTLFSLRFERSFFTLIHYWAYCFATWYSNLEFFKGCAEDGVEFLFPGYESNITVAAFSPLDLILFAEENLGTSNYIVAVRSPQLNRFLELVSDAKKLENEDAYLVILRLDSPEKVKETASALYSLNVDIVAAISSGNLLE